MEYYLYRLKFTTALHIGRDSGGPSLDNGQMTIHADTIFSALCCEGVHNNTLHALADYFREGILTISDALPYDGDELYLPKPIIHLGNKKHETDSSLKKMLKKMEYLPLSGFREYIENLSSPSPNFRDLRKNFGHLQVVTRAAKKGNSQSLPYHAASWRFSEGCGLYIIAGARDQQSLSLLETLLSNLGWSGIGGKRSSGWGKYLVEKVPVPEELLSLLTDEEASYQMLLGTALPREEEMDEIIGDGWYALQRRGGFINSETYADIQLKKRTIYMLGPGSCLPKRFKGEMFDLSDNGAHPVWRSGSTLFAGVNL